MATNHENHEQLPLFEGLARDPDGHNMPIRPVASKEEFTPINISLTERAENLTEALDLMAQASRGEGFGHASTTNPHKTKIISHYGEDNAFRMSSSITDKVDRDLGRAKDYFLKALGLGAVIGAGIEIEKDSSLDLNNQARKEGDRQWKKFLQTFYGAPNHKKLDKYRRSLRSTYKAIAGEEMPPTSTQIIRAEDKVKREALKASWALNRNPKPKSHV